MLHAGRAGGISFIQGILNVGEAISPPAIRAVKAAVPNTDIVLLDAPPGASCPVVETLREADFVVLVTEPTPFGWHDLQLTIRLVSTLELPAAVVVNRASAVLRENDWQRRLATLKIPVWAELTESRSVAEAYSRGEIAVQSVPEFARELEPVVKRLKASVHERACGH